MKKFFYKKISIMFFIVMFLLSSVSVLANSNEYSMNAEKVTIGGNVYDLKELAKNIVDKEHQGNSWIFDMMTKKAGIDNYSYDTDNCLVEYVASSSFLDSIAKNNETLNSTMFLNNPLIYVPVVSDINGNNITIGHVKIQYNAEKKRISGYGFSENLSNSDFINGKYFHFSEEINQFMMENNVSGADCVLIRYDTSFNDNSEKVLLIKVGEEYKFYDFMNSIHLSEKEKTKKIYDAQTYVALRKSYEEKLLENNNGTDIELGGAPNQNINNTNNSQTVNNKNDTDDSYIITSTIAIASVVVILIILTVIILKRKKNNKK